MIAVIRIAGRVGLRKDIVETLDRLRLRKKYSCVVFDTLKGTSNPAKEQLGMVKKVKDFVAFGEIDDETYKELLKARGQKSKTFFRLHPPRKGIDSKKHFGVGKGVLGNNKKMNELIRRML